MRDILLILTMVLTLSVAALLVFTVFAVGRRLKWLKITGWVCVAVLVTFVAGAFTDSPAARLAKPEKVQIAAVPETAPPTGLAPGPGTGWGGADGRYAYVSPYEKAGLEAGMERDRQAFLEEDQERVRCLATIQCWGRKHRAEATLRCTRAIERRAKYDYKWTHSWLDGKFSQLRWTDPRDQRDAGRITYIGDSIKFQNGFGAWMNYRYECDYQPNPEFGPSVIAVRIRRGRL